MADCCDASLRQLLQEMVRPEVLERILTSFSRATGLRAVLVGHDGQVQLTPAGLEQSCGFCREIQSIPLGRQKCCLSYARAGAEAVKYGEPYIFRCHAGLVAWAAPVMAGERHLASIICGQVLMWEPEDFFWEEIEEMTRPLGIPPEKLMRLAHQLPVIPADKVQAAAEMLFVTANHIMQTGYITLQQKREIAAQQARLGEEMQARKLLEQTVKGLNGKEIVPYSLQKEHELAGWVRRGDRGGAYRLLDGLLADILQRFPGDTKEVKARILELLVIISRAAVEGGANLKDLLEMNSAYVEELSRLETCDDLCLWISKVMGQFLDSVGVSQNIKNLNIIRKAVEFIRNHYNEHITVEVIARAAYVSPCYLSRVFKKELGCTVIEFLTRTRVEEAKKLLSIPEYTVTRVALEMGFEDSSYFSKVFQRVEGISPSQYRQKAQ